MKDLMTAFDEARFGKQASSKRASDDRSVINRIADYFAMSKLTPENRKLRDTLEQLIRDEQRLRSRAKSHILSANERKNEPASTGPVSWITDTVRSAIPGLAPTAAPKDDGIVKGADDDGPSTLGTLLHLGVMGTGAGIGAGIQRGSFGGRRAAELAAEHLPSGLSSEMGKVLNDVVKGHDVSDYARSKMTKWLQRQATRPSQIAALGGEPSGLLGGLRKKLEPLSDLITHGSLEATPRVSLLQSMDKAIPSKELREGILDRIRLMTSKARTKALSGKGLLGAPKGLLGAGIGAAAALPFFLWNIVRARRIRAQGGPAALSERSRAEKLLAEANKVSGKRKKLLEQLQPS